MVSSTYYNSMGVDNNFEIYDYYNGTRFLTAVTMSLLNYISRNGHLKYCNGSRSYY